MIYSPLRDKKIYIVVIDGVVTIAVFVIDHYYPSIKELATLIIGFFQAITGVLLAGYFQADNANLRLGLPIAHMRQIFQPKYDPIKKE